MKIAVIIPDRGDRKELTEFCLKQLSKMPYQFEVFHINHPPTSESCDLVPRIQEGVARAKQAGVDWCFVIENDDAYPRDYFEKYLPHLENCDFIGDDRTIYYNIFNRHWQEFVHPNRASLFTTAFAVSALEDFHWPPGDVRFLDILLWEYAMRKKMPVRFVNSGAVGIKHGIGKCGGVGHIMRLYNPDNDMEFLKSKVSPEHVDFYCKITKACTLV